MSNDAQVVPHWSLVLIVSGEGINFQEVSNSLKLESTETRIKDEVLNKLPLIVSEEDCWQYEIELADNEGLDPRMQALLQALEAAADALRTLREKHAVTLRLYVQSDYAKIFYRLVPDTLRRLADIGLPLEVSVVSWGGLHFGGGQG